MSKSIQQTKAKSSNSTVSKPGLVVANFGAAPAKARVRLPGPYLPWSVLGGASPEPLGRHEEGVSDTVGIHLPAGRIAILAAAAPGIELR